MIDFNIALAQQGIAVVKGDGTPVRIVSYNGEYEKYPIIGIHKNTEGRDCVVNYTANGSFRMSQLDSKEDLMLDIEPTENCWLYKCCPFASKKA